PAAHRDHHDERLPGGDLRQGEERLDVHRRVGSQGLGSQASFPHPSGKHGAAPDRTEGGTELAMNEAGKTTMGKKSKKLSEEADLFKKFKKLWERGQSDLCEVRGSKIHGRGVYATQDIPSGTK